MKTHLRFITTTVSDLKSALFNRVHLQGRETAFLCVFVCFRKRFRSAVLRWAFKLGTSGAMLLVSLSIQFHIRHCLRCANRIWDDFLWCFFFQVWYERPHWQRFWGEAILSISWWTLGLAALNHIWDACFALIFQVSQRTKTAVAINERVNGLGSIAASFVGTTPYSAGPPCWYHIGRVARLHCNTLHSRRLSTRRILSKAKQNETKTICKNEQTVCSEITTLETEHKQQA